METSIRDAISTVLTLNQMLLSWAAGEPFDGTTDEVTELWRVLSDLAVDVGVVKKAAANTLYERLGKGTHETSTGPLNIATPPVYTKWDKPALWSAVVKAAFAPDVNGEPTASIGEALTVIQRYCDVATGRTAQLRALIGEERTLDEYAEVDYRPVVK